jgi:hypothetical protein
MRGSALRVQGFEFVSSCEGSGFRVCLRVQGFGSVEGSGFRDYLFVRSDRATINLILEHTRICPHNKE